MHSVDSFADKAWAAARKRSFEDLRAITTCLVLAILTALVETPRSGQPTAQPPRFS
jgi:hypothetical protein